MDYNPYLGKKDVVIREHMGLARSIAKRFRWALPHAPHIDFQDIVSEACIGLIKAYYRFDGSHGVKFATYAEPWVQGGIRDFIRRQGGALRIPGTLYRLNGRILRDELQGSSPAEVASTLSCSETEAKRALQALRQVRSDSLDRPLGQDGEELVLLDTIGQPQDQSEINVHEFLSGLDPEERHFVQVRTTGERTEQPILLKSVQTKLAAYMELSESEVEEMSQELTKDKYSELKKQGRSDADIYTEFNMGQSQFYRLKSKWGLTDKGKKKPSSVKPVVLATQAVSPVVDQEDWKAKYDKLHSLHTEYVSADEKRFERFEAEIRLLKEMLKFYL